MSQPFVGEIRLFAFGRTPTGWFACNGAAVSIAEQEVLFTLIGTTYGGDGQTTFNLPDLRGRVPIHQGTGPGLSNYVIGQRSGSESVTLIGNQMPSHTHTLLATTSAATANAPAPNLQLGALSGDTMYVTDITGLDPIPMAANCISSAGNNQPHGNTMPTLTVQYCIAWAGIFPSQS
ncbi:MULTISPECIES: tail fiber protein [unclassified Lysobacter]|uniref:phage tail protein n=1 Tax=unclassified Lysobacter TaxID=2635362 RepID=UPI001BE6DFBA|nr:MULTISPECIES: tail fiber protein [unclassified Lysobacter]MBT2747288.1 phage tail protein [Lysobacter sp. ISL-42]MBT2753334.1 phage tail protein [Lysobacter sp. ISL-50]MBT2775444.1 phage tail protein [Lysobacter sp. ISL-54]MBT2783020.1 phage tail protein [Lysobacter sp. ISL-52]